MTSLRLCLGVDGSECFALTSIYTPKLAKSMSFRKSVATEKSIFPIIINALQNVIIEDHIYSH